MSMSIIDGYVGRVTGREWYDFYFVLSSFSFFSASCLLIIGFPFPSRRFPRMLRACMIA